MVDVFDWLLVGEVNLSFFFFRRFYLGVRDIVGRVEVILRLDFYFFRFLDIWFDVLFFCRYIGIFDSDCVSFLGSRVL